MKRYQVTFRIDVDAENEEQARMKAAAMITKTRDGYETEVEEIGIFPGAAKDQTEAG